MGFMRSVLSRGMALPIDAVPLRLSTYPVSRMSLVNSRLTHVYGSIRTPLSFAKLEREIL